MLSKNTNTHPPQVIEIDRLASQHAEDPYDIYTFEDHGYWLTLDNLDRPNGYAISFKDGQFFVQAQGERALISEQMAKDLAKLFFSPFYYFFDLYSFAEKQNLTFQGADNENL